MLSILFGIEIKTICYGVFYVNLYFCIGFQAPIVSRVNLTPTVPKGPKSEHNIRVNRSTKHLSLVCVSIMSFEKPHVSSTVDVFACNTFIKSQVLLYPVH